jgi:simple sugar transport system permease protein
MSEIISDEQTKTNHLEKSVRKFEKYFSIFLPFLTVLGAFLVSALLIFIVGESPFEAIKALVNGAFGTLYDAAFSLNRSTPLILAGLGIAIGIKGGIFNLGGEGQIAIGGLFTTIVGIYFQMLPPYILIPLCLLAGFLGGGLLGMIAGYLNAKLNINTIISTLMLNYIGFAIVSLMVKGPLQEPPGIYIQSPKVGASAILPILIPGTRLHFGFIIALIMAVIIYIVLYRTPFGYELRIIGKNEKAAKYAGINITRTKVLGFLISGGLCGLAGGVEIIGYQYRLREAFLPNYGFDAIAVALLGQLNSFGIILSGVLFGGLRAGASAMQRAIHLPQSLASVVQAIIILFVAGSSALSYLPKYFAKRSVKNDTE